MQKRTVHSFLIIVAVISVMTFCFLMIPTPPAEFEDTGPFNFLQSRLAGDGFDPEMLRILFRKPEVHFEPRTAAMLFTHREARVNYDQFLSSESLQSARKYIQDHLSDLISAEESFGVNKEVITAIMLVETRLGKYLGTSSILNTLSTIAALKDMQLRQIVWNSIPSDRRPEKSAFEEKADAKSTWAYKELKAYLIYTGREKIDPKSVCGSFAGAFGIPQFMPSNILTYARSCNQEGKIDLFNHSDAIMSVANYLKQFGWKPGISQDQAFNVVYQYNHSMEYVKTILKIADQLK